MLSTWDNKKVKHIQFMRSCFKLSMHLWIYLLGPTLHTLYERTVLWLGIALCLSDLPSILRCWSLLAECWKALQSRLDHEWQKCENTLSSPQKQCHRRHFPLQINEGVSAQRLYSTVTVIAHVLLLLKCNSPPRPPPFQRVYIFSFHVRVNQTHFPQSIRNNI